MFHCTLTTSEDQTGDQPLVGPKRKTAKAAVRIMAVNAIRAGYEKDRVRIELLEDDALVLSAYGDTPNAAKLEVVAMLDRNRRRYA
jgi:hypothetical protein